jgi:hypothetical protein
MLLIVRTWMDPSNMECTFDGAGTPVNQGHHQHYKLCSVAGLVLTAENA